MSRLGVAEFPLISLCRHYFRSEIRERFFNNSWDVYLPTFPSATCASFASFLYVAWRELKNLHACYRRVDCGIKFWWSLRFYRLRLKVSNSYKMRFNDAKCKFYSIILRALSFKLLYLTKPHITFFLIEFY